MGNIASYLVRHNVRNFYSVSISGDHIAEAGANAFDEAIPGTNHQRPV